jgi:Protein of unknown function (DUF1566)
MNPLLKLRLGILAIGMLALTSTLTEAQTIAPGPYYATPSWDQTLPASTRFIILSNFNSEAVMDRETGLVWERSPDATRRNRRQAAAVCHGKVIGARKGWRLPTIAELASLVDPGQAGPALPAGHPFVDIRFNLPILQVTYWSSSSFPEEAVIFLPPFPPTIDSEVMDFRSGTVTTSHSTASSLLSWCVRGLGGHNGR